MERLSPHEVEESWCELLCVLPKIEKHHAVNTLNGK